jgi:O-antigen ligase
MTAAWLMGSVRGDIPYRRYPLDLPLLLFLLINVVSWATMAINPFKSGVELTKLITFVLLYFGVSRCFHVSFLKPWIYVITLVTALVSIIGICQYLGIGFLWLRSTGYPSSTFVYRNFAAMYLIMCIPISLVPFIIARNLRTELFWGSLAAAPFIFLIYTRTRGAWVGFAGGVLLAWAIWWFIRKNPLEELQPLITKRKWALSSCFLTLIFFSAQLGSQIATTSENFPGLPGTKSGVVLTLKSVAEKKDGGRSMVWGHTLDMIRDHWLLGVGLGNWELTYPLYGRGELHSPGSFVKRPHNDILWIWAELGTAGLIVLFFLFGSTTVQLLRLLQSKVYTIVHLARVIGISLIAIAGHSLFSFPSERIPPLLFSFLILGVLSATYAHQSLKRYELKGLCIPSALGIWWLVLGIALTFRAVEADRLQYAISQDRLQSDWGKVIRHADLALQHGVIDHWILFWKAHALHMTGDIAYARETYEKCLSYHPNELTTIWKIGILEQSIGNLAQAQLALERAVFLDSDNAGFLQDLGANYQLQGKHQDALQAYQRAKALGADDLQLFLNMGGIYEAGGRHEEAVSVYKEFLGSWAGDAATGDLVREKLLRLE